MGALGLLVRRSLRAHGRGALGLALVLALAGGVALAALAGARRTDSAFPRYLEASGASDVSVNVYAEREDVPTDLASALAITERARDLPGYEADASYIGLENVVLTNAAGDPSGPYGVEVLGSLDGRFLDQDQVAVLEGRVPDPEAQDEVLVNEQAADLIGITVGATVDLAAVVGLDELEDGDPTQLPVVGRVRARVVGIGQFPDEVLGDDIDGSPRMLVTPAVTVGYLKSAGSYAWQGLRLEPGTNVDATISAYEAMLPDGYAINVQRTDVQLDRVQRSVRPIVAALLAFGATAALAALALGGLAALRLIGAARSDTGVMRALGLSAPRRAAVVAAPALAGTAIGIVGAMGVALALSPLTPVGPVRAVEPNPGMVADLGVLGAAGTALVVALVALILVAAGRAVGRHRADGREAARPSRFLTRLAALGFSPAAMVGTRHALGGETRRDGVPVRATIAACVVSVVAIGGALGFGASVQALLDHPASYGWAADLAVQSGGGYADVDLAGVDAATAVPDVAGMTIAGFASLTVGGDQINAMGILPVEGPALITVVRGAVPARPDQVALGGTTARRLHASIGDTIEGEGGPLTVVGIVALPAIGPLATAHPSLGQGALLTLDGLTPYGAYPSLVLVDLADTVDPTETAERVTTVLATAPNFIPPDAASSLQGLRPAEVVGLQPASRTMYLLAALLGAAAVFALALTLSSSVRRRQPTYATLSALGMDQRDLRRAARWQTNVVTFLALAIGIPLGIVVGRTTWTALADQLGVAAGPQVPIALLALAAAALLLVANLAGEQPARSAGRSRATLVRRG